MNVNPNPLRVRIEEIIPSSRGDVFDAVVNAKKIVKHFANKASGDLVERARVTWDFGEYGSVELHVREIRFNSLIVFEWPASGLSCLVSIRFEDDTKGTRVSVVEDGWKLTIDGGDRLMGQTQGWTGFLLGLKAYLVHGINLREDTKGK